MKKVFSTLAAMIVLTAGLVFFNTTKALAFDDGWGCRASVNNGNIHPYYTVSGKCANYVQKFRAVAVCWPGLKAYGPWVTNTSSANSKAMCFFTNVTDHWTDVIFKK